MSSSLDRLLSASPTLAAALRGVDRALASDSPILLLGEPGTGRSTLARALHAEGARHAGPLVEVDPGLVPSSLFESELFGHAAGAFTGAEQARPGRVADAEGGILVLDHVEELPLASQPKLLRLLAERRFSPLGGRERSADVRFIALGSADLPRRVELGAFRADLFYRLEVLTFRLPPLRERLGDLRGIVDLLLEDLAERFGRAPLRLSPRSERWMRTHAWPGNLRQLRNLLERALVNSGGEELAVDPAEEADDERPRSLAEVEREQIRAALAYARGHQGRAAEVLGISRKTLWEKRRRHGLP